MFAVDHVLVSERITDATFSCALNACKGACCVVGEAGAPLLAEECEILEDIHVVVAPRLDDEARDILEQQGPWERDEESGYAVPCRPDGACVFSVRQSGITLCALQQAYHAGEIDFPKPVSCHLYPIRVKRVGPYEMLQYEQIDLCAPGREQGARDMRFLAQYLQEPLERRFGRAWYERFVSMIEARRSAQ